MTEAIEDPAGAFGANNIPLALKAVSVLGMQQSRKWNLGTFNEFRKFFGLKPHATFEDINSGLFNFIIVKTIIILMP